MKKSKNIIILMIEVFVCIIILLLGILPFVKDYIFPPSTSSNSQTPDVEEEDKFFTINSSVTLYRIEKSVDFTTEPIIAYLNNNQIANNEVNYSFTSSLTNDFTIDSSNGRISGNTDVIDDYEITINATYKQLSSSTVITLSIVENYLILPDNTPDNIFAPFKTNIETEQLTILDGINNLPIAHPKFTITPILSPGLNLDEHTGVISGQVDSLLPSTSDCYTLTVEDIDHPNRINASRSIFIRLVKHITNSDLFIFDSNTSAEPDINIFCKTNDSISTQELETHLQINEGSGDLIDVSNNATYTISPALPVGLDFDEDTGVISGSCTSTVVCSTYTITSSYDFTYSSFWTTNDNINEFTDENDTITVTTSVDITIQIIEKSIRITNECRDDGTFINKYKAIASSSSIEIAQALIVEDENNNTIPTPSSNLIFSIDHPLPTGLSINAYSGRIYGVPSPSDGHSEFFENPANNYTITATYTISVPSSANPTQTIDFILTDSKVMFIDIYKPSLPTPINGLTWVNSGPGNSAFDAAITNFVAYKPNTLFPFAPTLINLGTSIVKDTITNTVINIDYLEIFFNNFSNHDVYYWKIKSLALSTGLQISHNENIDAMGFGAVNYDFNIRCINFTINPSTLQTITISSDTIIAPGHKENYHSLGLSDGNPANPDFRIQPPSDIYLDQFTFGDYLYDEIKIKSSTQNYDFINWFDIDGNNDINSANIFKEVSYSVVGSVPTGLSLNSKTGQLKYVGIPAGSSGSTIPMQIKATIVTNGSLSITSNTFNIHLP